MALAEGERDVNWRQGLALAKRTLCQGRRPVSTRQKKLSPDEIRRSFMDGTGAKAPAILSPLKLAELIGISLKTTYQWIANGRLDGAFRKRGKHILIWRDRAIDILFNGPEWNHD